MRYASHGRALLDRVPLRLALAGVYAAALAAAFALLAVVFYAYLGRSLRAALDSELTAEVRWVDSYLSEPGGFPGSPQLPRDPDWSDLRRRYLAADRNYSVEIFSADGVPLFSAGQALGGQGLAQPDDRRSFTRIDVQPDKRLHVATHRSDRYRFHVAASERPILEVERRTLWVLLSLAPVCLIGAVAGGWLVAGLALRPVKHLTEVARRISASNLDERIPPRPAADELGQLVDSFNRMVERLDASFRQINEFSSNVAHELRTPLTLLRGEAELALSRDLTPEQAHELVSSFYEEAVRMGRVVDDMLTLALADRGQVPLDLHDVDVGAILREIHEDALILAAERSIEVRLGRVDAARVRGDGARLRQLLRALISNAVRYTDAGGTIGIEGIVRGGVVHVAVEDTGVGIAPEHLPRIFERFYRVDSGRSRERSGAGVGLALAQWIATAHGGRIEATSAPGKGTRFVVELPLASGPSGA